MILDKTHYFYDKEQNKFIGCIWREYERVDPRFMLDNFNKVKHDQFVLSYEEDIDYHIAESCNQHVITTVCLTKGQDLTFITLICKSVKKYIGYQKRCTSKEEAMRSHDEIVLKIVRYEDL